MKSRIVVFFLFFFIFLFVWLPASMSQASSVSAPTPKEPMSFPGLFTPPPTVNPPTQADQGAQTFFYICMVCHGDQGQGLDLWRKKLDPSDNNCWQSKCHAPNHMDFGFTFPKEVPAVKGPGMLNMFQTADNLYTFIKGSMPYQNPGSLTDEQYWQLTAFLLRLNGVDAGTQPLDAARAKTIFLLPQTPAPGNSPGGNADPLLIGAGVFFAITAVGIGLFFYRRRQV